MTERNPIFLDENLIHQKEKIKRRSLLPWWIKTFIWIFFVLGASAFAGIILGVLGINFQISFYGLNTNQVFTVVGIILTFIFILKGIVSYALWTEKDWAISLGSIDALIGIVICLYVMIVEPFTKSNGLFSINFRLELILLIIFLIRLQKIKTQWMNSKE